MITIIEKRWRMLTSCTLYDIYIVPTSVRPWAFAWGTSGLCYTIIIFCTEQMDRFSVCGGSTLGALRSRWRARCSLIGKLSCIRFLVCAFSSFFSFFFVCSLVVVCLVELVSSLPLCKPLVRPFAWCFANMGTTRAHDHIPLRDIYMPTTTIREPLSHEIVMSPRKSGQIYLTTVMEERYLRLCHGL